MNDPNQLESHAQQTNLGLARPLIGWLIDSLVAWFSSMHGTWLGWHDRHLLLVMMENEIQTKIPTRADILKQQLSRRRYFDSGDYAMSKASSQVSPNQPVVGKEHPAPDSIPHRDAVLQHMKSSPVRRGSCLGPNRDDE